jgi:hypothetical protein
LWPCAVRYFVDLDVSGCCHISLRRYW